MRIRLPGWLDRRPPDRARRHRLVRREFGPVDPCGRTETAQLPRFVRHAGQCLGVVRRRVRSRLLFSLSASRPARSPDWNPSYRPRRRLVLWPRPRPSLPARRQRPRLSGRHDRPAPDGFAAVNPRLWKNSARMGESLQLTRGGTASASNGNTRLNIGKSG